MKARFANEYLINQLNLLVENKQLNDTCAEHLVMNSAQRIKELQQELDDLKASTPKIKAGAVREFGKAIGLYDSECDDQEYI